MMLAMPIVLFPALAEEVFGKPQLLGLALLRGDRRRSGRDGAVGLDVAGAPPRSRDRAGGDARTARASRSPACHRSIWVALLFFALAGAADMISAVFRGTIWNQTIPDNMRGRLAGIEMLSYSIGPLAGQVRAGFVADRWTVRGSIVSGGVSLRRRGRAHRACGCTTSGATTRAPTSMPWPRDRPGSSPVSAWIT